VDGGALQLGLFDEKNLLELTHPDFPGERLVACRNTCCRAGWMVGSRAGWLMTTGDLEGVQAGT
jgi:hypothetical protein